ncbi:MAG: zinc dependent phospholipase C family protein [Gemmatimonadota bacterium]
MPCATIHMLTAGRALRDWQDRSARAPFSVHEKTLRRSFLLGAMGPDMGFVPGVDRLMSELAHYISTGRLARALLDEAETPRQRAFAWGWATHHVTDVEIHPLVGRACGEHLLGDRSIRLNSSEDCETHVAMEVGLDLVFLATEPGIPEPADEPLESAEEIAFLARALERTYGIRWDTDDLRASHATATGRTARWPRVLGMLGRARSFTPGWADGGVVRLLGRPLLSLAHSVAPSGSATAGFLRPLEPPDWLVDEVRNVADGFARRFRVVVEDRMAGLEDRNLETGLLEFAPQDHPDSAKARRRLLELQEGQTSKSYPSAARA